MIENMILTVHSVVGAAIVNQFSFKWWSYLLAFGSHFLLDFLPHREYSIENLEAGWRKKEFWKDTGKIFLDLSLGLILIFLFSKNSSHLFAIFLGGLFALFPDALSLLSLLLKEKNYRRFLLGEKWEVSNKENSLPLYYKIHKTIHFNKAHLPPLFWGIFNQFIILLTALALL